MSLHPLVYVSTQANILLVIQGASSVLLIGHSQIYGCLAIEHRSQIVSKQLPCTFEDRLAQSALNPPSSPVRSRPCLFCWA